MFVEYSVAELEELINVEKMPKIRIVSGKRTVIQQGTAENAINLGKNINVKLLAQSFKAKRHASGSNVFKKGEEITEMHIIVQGKVSIKLDGEIVKSLSSGDLLGEKEMLGDCKTKCDADFSTDGVTIVIKKNEVQNAIALDPVLAYKIIGILGGYINQLQNQLEKIKK